MKKAKSLDSHFETCQTELMNVSCTLSMLAKQLRDLDSEVGDGAGFTLRLLSKRVSSLANALDSVTIERVSKRA